MVDEISPQRQVALRIRESASAEEQVALQVWIERLLEVRAREVSSLEKARSAVAVTLDSKVVWPTVKILGREVKRLAWDDRGLKGRLGLGGAAVGIAFFGGKAAGVAALGTAIGVPLWVVLGAGAAFAGVLYEELTGHKPTEGSSTTHYRIIDAVPEDDEQPPRD